MLRDCPYRSGPNEGLGQIVIGNYWRGTDVGAYLVIRRCI